ncbi:MAG: alpha/beta fold hydrolase [Actinomycetota bacterium]
MTLRPPSFAQRSKELLVGRDVARLFVRTPHLRQAPRGDGRPVVVVTGFGGTDLSLTALRGYLGWLGHDARLAELGRIGQDVPGLVGRLIDRCASVRSETGESPALVGWSLGGTLSRETARRHPELVRRIVTFGTPVEGGPAYTALAWRYTDEQIERIHELIDTRYETPIEVPITALWSRNDGVVTPEACIDRRTPGVEHVEVTSTHLGMGVDPDVWSAIAERLTTTIDP